MGNSFKQINSMTKLYVGNLNWETTEESLRLAFSQDDRTVTEVNIISDRDTGRPRGFAFIEMGSKEDAEAATAALHETDLDGRQIKVNQAKERNPGGSGGSRGGERGGGGGYGGGGGGYGGGGGGRGGGRW